MRKNLEAEKQMTALKAGAPITESFLAAVALALNGSKGSGNSAIQQERPNVIAASK